jgi:5-methylthioadenosine/S-adenosylhomocysteine deaminase
MKLASGIAPVCELAARGVNVALGTDGAASNNRLDLFGEMRLASLLAKVASGDAASLPAADVLRMATLGGARALSLDQRIGSIVAGKDADLVAVDMGELADAPLYDPISHLVHVTSRERVTDVWVGGERIVRERRLTTVDAAALSGRVQLWQQKLAQPPRTDR